MGGKSSKNKEKTDKGKRQTQVEEPADPNAVDYIFKLLLVGDAAVGKTCLIVRYTQNTYTDQFQPTLDTEYKSRKIKVGSDNVELQLFDTAGQERFRVITASYYRQGNGVFIVYDVTKRETFDNVRQWHEQIQRYGKDGILKFLVANKIDDAANRVVSTQEGKALAQELDIEYFETSAKENINVDEMMAKVAKACVAAKEDK